MSKSTTAIRAIGVVLVGLSVAALAACAPEPVAEPTSSASLSVSASATPSASATASPDVDTSPSATPISFTVPATCEQAYSAAMFASLKADLGSLNDPGVDLLSTQNGDLQDLLHSGAATIRCTWGPPSERGIATTITAVTAAQGSDVLASLQSTGSGCEPLGDGTICRFEQRGISLDDNEYTRGETHYVGDGGWIATAWINVNPDGYTEDIVATLWG